jgi:hypothetical protein
VTRKKEAGIGSRAQAVLILTSWLPLALWFVALAYVRRLEGWGEWAGARVLLPAVVLSAVLGAAGSLTTVLGYRAAGRVDRTLLAATALASSPILYLIARTVLG